MKKIISTLCILFCLFTAKAQILIQKAYTPQTGEHYFELLNNTNTLQDLSCFSLITHFRNLNEEGFFVVRFPSATLQPKEVMILGSVENLNPENPLNRIQYSWPQLALTGYMQKFLVNENRQQISEGKLDAANPGVSNRFRSDLDYVEHVVLLLNGSNVIDASVTIDAENNLPDFLNRLPSITYNNTCNNRVTIAFNGLKNRFPNIFNRPNLPNEYGYFKEFEVQKNSASVQIAWQTAREQNNRGFYIERRTGSGPWSTVAYVASVAPGGNSDNSLQYYYGDKNVLNERSEYRLRQVDVNGRAMYSPSRSLDASGNARNLVIYPNPSYDGRANISFGQVNALRDIQVIDISGQLIQQWVSVNNHSQQLQNLRSGHYIIRVIERQTGAVYTQKLIVSNN